MNKKSKSKIIVDPRGQWAHPGVPTRIPGNDITMDNVPYPVMAYPDFGSPVMMHPEEEYNFPGAKYVDEYPELKKGGNKANSHLVVKQSKIAGADKGLFANTFFKKNQLIGLAHRNGQPVGEIGKMHNHSDTPNMYSVKKGNERYVYAKRDIKAGEELTTDYRLQPELEQPEDFKKGGQTPKVRIPTGSKGIKSKAYSRSLEATNRLFALNPLFEVPKSRKRKIFDPNASFYADGGIVSFDYDDTLTTDAGMEMAMNTPSDQKYIISAREEVTPDMITRARNAGIPEDRIFAMGSDEAKVAKVRELGIDRHIDNKQSVIDKLGFSGQLFQFGGSTTPQEWGKEIKAIENQIGNPKGWTLDDYNLIQNKLNEYRNWRETTPEGQAVVDSHNEEGEYDIPLPSHLQDYTSGMMKAKLAYANEFGNPAAKRMVVPTDNPYQFENGNTGTHYMASMDNYAVPQIQNENGQLMLGDYGPESNEAIRFNNPADAQYFAEHYKSVSPAFLNKEQKGGALLTKKVTCKKCGWKWNAADGSDDVTTCHKCGGQGLVHAQKGGEEIPSLPLREGRTAYKRWAYGVNDKMAMQEDGGYVEMDLTPQEIEQYRKGGYIVEELPQAQEGSQQPIIDKSQDEAETFAYAKASDKERWKELMDKSKALMNTAQGRKLWYQDLKPKDFSIKELQRFTQGVKEHNQGAQDYERARRKVQEGKISTSDFARLYDERGWGKYDQATMKEGYKGQYQDAVDQANTRKEANMGVTDAVLELTGAPALLRIAKDPMGTLKGVGNTVADVALSANPGIGSAFGTGNTNINPLTGNQYWSGLDKTLDVAGVLPGIGSLGKLGKVGKFGKVGSYAEDVLGTSKKITSAPKNMNIKLLPDNVRSQELDMETFGVYKGDTKVGEVSGNRLSSGDFETLDIGVDPKFQRQGIGTEVYKQLNESLPEGNKVRSWGAFVENNGVAPGRNTWQSLERQGLAKQNEKGIYEMLPKKSTKSLGGKALQQEEDGGFIELDLDDEEIEYYRKGGFTIEEVKFQDGGVPTVPTMQQSQSPVVTPMLAPDMMPTGDLVAPPVVTEPVVATTVQQPATLVNTPVVDQPTLTKKEVEKIAMPKIEQSGDVKAIQKKLVAAGYNIGASGPSRDGVDGIMGNRTKMALDAFNSGIPPSKVKTIEPKKQSQSTKYTVNKNLGVGYLPYLDKGEGEEVCVEGKGCSFNVSVKMSNLLGEIADGDIWANDAWFNKSDVLNKGGDLIYETTERDMAKMPKVPKDVYAKLQVGDYVQLNRMNTKTSGEFASETKGGLENENVEHLGFVVGKDKDGTPLIWHASEKGKAFIKRLDEPISLDDHDKSVFTYQVASIVRSPSLKNADLSGLQNTGYYSTVDPKLKLVAGKTATERQKQATGVINNNVRNIKNLGYSQEDTNFVGQILVGGIMQNESSGGESNKRIPKQVAATVYKDVLGQGAFEGDEASIGYYQMKPTLNFVNKDGSLNALGKKLEKLGVDPKDIGTFDIEAQTKAGAIILLDNYEKLKKDKDFNVKTGLYKGKIPASYILAKSWQAGSDWYKREKYQKYINNFDIDYSNNVLKQANEIIGNTSSTNQLQKEYSIVQKGITAREKASEDAQREQVRKDIAEKNKKQAEYEKSNPNFAYSKLVPTESTAVYNPYKDANKLKPFVAPDYTKKVTLQSTVYKYPERPGVTYKKDSNGKWYINTGKSTGNTYVPIKDPSGSRTKALVKGAVKAKEGGMVANLTQAEINRYIKDGYVIEEID
jgi:hypothetical protein